MFTLLKAPCDAGSQYHRKVQAAIRATCRPRQADGGLVTPFVALGTPKPLEFEQPVADWDDHVT